jgi:hypothetical protein
LDSRHRNGFTVAGVRPSEFGDFMDKTLQEFVVIRAIQGCQARGCGWRCDDDAADGGATTAAAPAVAAAAAAVVAAVVAAAHVLTLLLMMMLMLLVGWLLAYARTQA